MSRDQCQVPEKDPKPQAPVPPQASEPQGFGKVLLQQCLVNSIASKDLGVCMSHAGVSFQIES